MEKLKVKGLKRENDKVNLTLLDYNPKQVKMFFKDFKFEVVEEENTSPVVVIKQTKANSGKLTKILNEKIDFIKQLESRFKQYALISTINELEIYPQGEQEAELMTAPIQSVLDKFSDRFDIYLGGGSKMRHKHTISSRDFKKAFKTLSKGKYADSVYMKGKHLNIHFRNNKFVISGENLRPVMRQFMKNG
jgi:hypothetical protein